MGRIIPYISILWNIIHMFETTNQCFKRPSSDNPSYFHHSRRFKNSEVVMECTQIFIATGWGPLVIRCYKLLYKPH